MKYVIFFMTLFASIPGSFLLIQRRIMRLAPLMLFVPILLYDNTAINFFSHEDYRGTSRGMEISLAYIVALMMLLGCIFRGTRLKIVPNVGAVLYLLYFFLSLPSCLNSDFGIMSFCEAWKMMMLYLLYLAVYNYLVTMEGDLSILLYAFAALMLIIGLTVIKEHFNGFYQIRTFFPHQNSMAMFVEPLGTLMLACFLGIKKPLWGLVAFGLFGLAGISIIRTYSRGAIMVFPIGCFTTFVASIIADWHGWKAPRVLILGVPVCICIAVFAPRIIQRFESAPKSSGDKRVEMAQIAVNMINAEPLLGIGLNNWGLKVNPPYPYSARIREELGHSESFKEGVVETIYLLVAAECGIPALLSLLALFAYHWLQALLLLWPLRGTRLFIWPAGFLGGMTVIYIQSVLEWVLKQQVNFILLMIIFAIIGYLKHIVKNHKKYPLLLTRDL